MVEYPVFPPPLTLMRSIPLLWHLYLRANRPLHPDRRPEHCPDLRRPGWRSRSLRPIRRPLLFFVSLLFVDHLPEDASALVGSLSAAAWWRGNERSCRGRRSSWCGNGRTVRASLGTVPNRATVTDRSTVLNLSTSWRGTTYVAGSSCTSRGDGRTAVYRGRGGGGGVALTAPGCGRPRLRRSCRWGDGDSEGGGDGSTVLTATVTVVGRRGRHGQGRRSCYCRRSCLGLNHDSARTQIGVCEVLRNQLSGML